MKILVTGADGFVAHHLIPLLLKEKAEVIGTALNPEKAKDLMIPIRPLDISKEGAVASLIRHVNPTHIIHLAAVSSVRESFQNPQATEDVNVQGTKNILDGALALPKAPTTLLIGSSDEYGSSEAEPFKELAVEELKPVSPYGKSKKAVEELVEGNPKYKSFVVRTRSFPHIGPGQTGKFFIPEVAIQIIKAERGDQPPIIGVGNLAAIRDFTDVRDVASAYWLLLNKGKLGQVYNVCSGQSISILELLKKMISFAKVKITFREDPAKIRPVDIAVSLGDNSKIKKELGWEPKIPLDQTLKEILEYFRSRLS